MRRALTLLFVMTAALRLSAQVDFRSGIDLVALNVVVTDPGQKFVTGLDAGQFTVLEDGVAQDVAFFAAAEVPIDLALLLDTSSSMGNKMATVQEAAIGFASTLRDGDRLAVIDIKEGMKILHAFSGDIAAAQQAIRQTTARGGTALYNGLYLTLREMAKERVGRTELRRGAIVVLSDGDDTASLVGYDEVLEVARQSGIAIYTIALREPFDVSREVTDRGRMVSKGEFAMRSLAQETGARSYFPTDIAELAGVYDSIAQELAHQYSIGFTSKNPRRDGAYRRLLVRVSEPGVRIRTRAGYIAGSSRNY